jgi:hypothetical protein
MASVVGRSQFGQDLCRALGLDPGRVRSLDLRCAADEIITVQVVQSVTDTQTKEIGELMKRYRLVEEHGQEGES